MPPTANNYSTSVTTVGGVLSRPIICLMTPYGVMALMTPYGVIFAARYLEPAVRLALAVAPLQCQ